MKPASARWEQLIRKNGIGLIGPKRPEDVKLLGAFKHTIDRFLGGTAAVSDVLLAETQACQAQDLSVLGHMSDFLRIIYAIQGACLNSKVPRNWFPLPE